MKAIFGLGNPGKLYMYNRHNVGFMVVEKLALMKGAKFKGSFRLKVKLAVTKIGDTDVLLFKPRAFMNVSGVSVKKAIRHYKLKEDDCLVIYDDINLPLGRVKFREFGSHGGHRGMASIIDNLNTDKVNRLRIGIDSQIRGNMDLADYVLEDFSPQEKETLDESIDKSVAACVDWVNAGGQFVMNKYN